MAAKRVVTSFIRRRGSRAAMDDEWADRTIEERLAAVWTLTLGCLGWGNEGLTEPRLQRSAVRIQRRRR